MESQNTDVLSVRSDHPKEIQRYTGGRSKSRGRSKSPRYLLKRLCWKCSKPGHLKKHVDKKV